MKNYSNWLLYKSADRRDIRFANALQMIWKVWKLKGSSAKQRRRKFWVLFFRRALALGQLGRYLDNTQTLRTTFQQVNLWSLSYDDFPFFFHVIFFYFSKDRNRLEIKVSATLHRRALILQMSLQHSLYVAWWPTGLVRRDHNAEKVEIHLRPCCDVDSVRYSQRPTNSDVFDNRRQVEDE